MIETKKITPIEDMYLRAQLFRLSAEAVIKAKDAVVDADWHHDEAGKQAKREFETIRDKFMNQRNLFLSTEKVPYGKSEEVELGSYVVFEDEFGEDTAYLSAIMMSGPSHVARMNSMSYSITSPFGEQILGKRPGDKFQVIVNPSDGRKIITDYKVLEILPVEDYLGGLASKIAPAFLGQDFSDIELDKPRSHMPAIEAVSWLNFVRYINDNHPGISDEKMVTEVQESLDGKLDDIAQKYSGSLPNINTNMYELLTQN